MASAIYERSFSGNLPLKLAAQMKYEVLKQTFWGKFAKFNNIGQDVRKVHPGNEPQPIMSPVVIQHELDRKMGDEIHVPMLRNLKALPKVGTSQMEGYEEKLNMNFARVPIDILRHAYDPQEGIMMTQTTKDYQLLERYNPILTRHYARTSDLLQCTYALLKAYSYNILASNRFTGNAKIKAISHPNVFVAGQGQIQVSGANYPGTAGWETTLGTAMDSVANTHVLNTAFLNALKASKTVQMLDPLIMKDGNPFWLYVVHPYQIATLEADTAFQAMANSVLVQNLAKENPIMVGARYFYGGFALFVTDQAVWPVWKNATSGKIEYGPATVTDLDSYENYSADTKFASFILGNNALFKATGKPLEYKKRMADYDEIIGIAYRTVEGYSRADYFNEDDGTWGQYVKNYGSALAITYAEEPAF